MKIAVSREQFIDMHDVLQLNPVARTRPLTVDTAHRESLPFFRTLGHFIPVRSDIDDLDIGERAVCRLVLTVTVEHIDAYGVVDVV